MLVLSKQPLLKQPAFNRVILASIVASFWHVNAVHAGRSLRQALRGGIIPTYCSFGQATASGPYGFAVANRCGSNAASTYPYTVPYNAIRGPLTGPGPAAALFAEKADAVRAVKTALTKRLAQGRLVEPGAQPLTYQVVQPQLAASSVPVGATRGGINVVASNPTSVSNPITVVGGRPLLGK